MRHALVSMLVVVPLLTVGCKKKEPEVMAAPPEPLQWTFGPASRAGEVDGTLTIPVKVVVPGTIDGLVVRSWNVGVDTDAGRVCVIEGDELQKATPGSTLEFNLRGNCDTTRLPTGDELPILGTILYSHGPNADGKLDVARTIQITR